MFKDFHYQTRTSWSCERRVTGMAEYMARGEKPRFIVTTLAADELDGRLLGQSERLNSLAAIVASLES